LAVGAIMLAAVLALSACGQGRGAQEPLEQPPSSTGGMVTSATRYEMGYSAESEGKGTYEVRVRVFQDAVLDPATGKMSVQIFDDAGFNGHGEQLDPLPCGYQDASDLVVPVSVSTRRMDADMSDSTAHVKVQWLRGFRGRDLDAFVNRIGLMDSTCDLLEVADFGQQYVSHNPTWGSSPAGQWVHSESFLYLRGAKRLSAEKKAELLGSLSVEVDPTSLFESGDRVKVTYQTPDTVRLLTGNGCLAVFEPLDLGYSNEDYTTLGAQNCQPVVWQQK
jgi:hypothetical protein